MGKDFYFGIRGVITYLLSVEEDSQILDPEVHFLDQPNLRLLSLTLIAVLNPNMKYGQKCAPYPPIPYGGKMSALSIKMHIIGYFTQKSADVSSFYFSDW